MKKLQKPLKVSTLSGKWTCHEQPILLTIYKSFVRPHLDYGHIILDQPYNSNFTDTFKSVYCTIVLAIIGFIWGSSKEKLYQELELESSRNRIWSRRMSYSYKIISTKLPPLYFLELIPPLQRSNRYYGLFTLQDWTFP